MYLYMSLTLAANEVRPVAVFGRYFRVLDNSITTSPVIRIGANSPQTIPAGVGIDLFDGVDANANTFDQIIIQNPTAGVMTLNIAMSNSHVEDSRFSASSTINTSDANVLAKLQGITTAGTYAQVTVGTSAVAIHASSSTRNGCMIQSDPTNTAKIYLGFDASVTSSAKFFVLNPGDSWTTDNYRGDVYAIAAIAGQIVNKGAY